MITTSQKIPVWFYIASAFFFLWNIMGITSFFMHTFVTEETLNALPANERALYGEYPFWVTIAFALAVFGGTLGSIGLLMQKKWAKTAFIISLIGIIPQMIHNIFFTSSMEVYGPGQAATMPILVVIFGIFLIWFAQYSIKKGWLK